MSMVKRRAAHATHGPEQRLRTGATRILRMKTGTTGFTFTAPQHTFSPIVSTNAFQKTRIAVLTATTILFPVTFYYLSPVISIMGSTVGIVSGSIMVFLIQFLASAALGRSFCSWVCPAGGIQDQAGLSRTKPLRVSNIAWIKWIVWGAWLAAILFFFGRAGGIKSLQFGYSTEMGLSTTSVPALISYSVVVLVFFLLSLVFGRRAGCHTLCWMAPFMVLGRKLGLAFRLPTLHLETHPANCVACGKCTSTCPMSLDVEKLVTEGHILDTNCILCGRCMHGCRKDVLAWAWRKKTTGELVRQ